MRAHDLLFVQTVSSIDTLEFHLQCGKAVVTLHFALPVDLVALNGRLEVVAAAAAAAGCLLEDVADDDLVGVSDSSGPLWVREDAPVRMGHLSIKSQGNLLSSDPCRFPRGRAVVVARVGNFRFLSGCSSGSHLA